MTHYATTRPATCYQIGPFRAHYVFMGQNTAGQKRFCGRACGGRHSLRRLTASQRFRPSQSVACRFGNQLDQVQTLRLLVFCWQTSSTITVNHLRKHRLHHLHPQGQWQAERGVPDVRLPDQIKLTPFASSPGHKSSPQEAPQATQVSEVFVAECLLAGRPQLCIDVSGPDTDGLDLQERFDWRAQWYPVAVVSDLDPSRPHATKLLGMHPLLP